MKVGDKVRIISPGSSRTPGTITRLRLGQERDVEVEFTGAAWFFPYRTWFAEAELTPATDDP
jgi:hypothetical protein